MMRPDFYPEKPPAVEFRQTHMSCVFIAGDLVYKIKKPVHFGFVDAFDLCTRFLFCREEVRLNRRLAPGVYLDVVPIIDDGSRYVLGGPDDLYQDRVCEYAVKMRRLPEDRMLDYIVRAGAAGSPAIEAIARKLVSFHAGVSSARAGHRHIRCHARGLPPSAAGVSTHQGGSGQMPPRVRHHDRRPERRAKSGTGAGDDLRARGHRLRPSWRRLAASLRTLAPRYPGHIL